MHAPADDSAQRPREDTLSRWAGYDETGDGPRDAPDGPTLFGPTMGLVAITTGLFSLGAHLGRHLSPDLGFICFIGAFICLIAMRFARRRPDSSATGLLFIFGSLTGLASAPTFAYYADTNPQSLWLAGGATALFMAALGSAGYASRRDLSAIGRMGFWALLALILFGVVLIFVQIPHGEVIDSLLGLVIFAGRVKFDFQRLRRVRDIRYAPMIVASIFLDILNVFEFFLTLGNRRR